MLAGTEPWRAITAGLLAVAAASSAFAGDTLDVEFFEKNVRPVLVEQCFDCHSAAAKKTKGGLQLDSRAKLLAGGDTGPAIIPGKPEESLLYKAITHADSDLAMPAKKPKLSDEVIANFKQWITTGATWPDSAVAVGGDSTKPPFDLTQRKQRLPWIWETPRKQKLPLVRNRAWPANAADAFILAKLEQKDILPAPPAEPQTWLRRVHFVITGLPPTLNELHEFLADSSPAAREKVVDHLLGSPHYGERWTRHWMDLVRYAESRGHESDYIIANAYQYRDYLIRAFNVDLPYDQFVREQIAGDLLPTPRLNPANGANESVLGTGWVFLGEEVHSPVDIRQDECDRTDNKVDVLGKTFLGLTLGCARCHDHKFDAISAQDYYAMSGFVLSSSYRQVPFESMEQNRRIAGELEAAREIAQPKIAAAVASSFKQGLAQVPEYLISAHEVIAGSDDDVREERVGTVAAKQGLSKNTLNRWLTYLDGAAKDPRDPLHLVAQVVLDAQADEEGHLADLINRAKLAEPVGLPADARVILDYSNPKLSSWKVDGPAFGNRPMRVGEVCLGVDPDRPVTEVMPYPAARRDPFWNKLKTAPSNEEDSGTLAATGRAGQMLVTPTFTLGSGKLHYLFKGKTRVYAAVASHLMIAGPLHAQLMEVLGSTNTAPTWVTHDLSRYSGLRAHLEFGPDGDSELEVLMVVESDEKPTWLPGDGSWFPDSTVTSLPQLVRAQQQALKVACERLSQNSIASARDSSRLASLANWLVKHPELVGPPNPKTEPAATKRFLARVRELDRQARWESKTAVAWFDGTGVDENVLIRGKANRTGVLAPRGLPAAFPGAAPIQPANSSGRYQLAQQMTDPANPLVARVVVNRIWHHLFGRGIVPTVDNFGYLGERPSHPELLNELSWEFVHQDKWSVKKLIKGLVLSSTFAMSSQAADPHAEEVDASNVLLHRMPVRRLEGETIRDALLAVSGRLDPTIGGPPVQVYLTDFMVGRGRPEKSGPLDGDGRRSIYTMARRNFLPTFMLTFDMPTPFSTIGRRNVTNVPGQSLALMNDPLVHDQSRVWAERLVREKKDAPAEERIRWLFESAYARDPSAAELAACRDSLAELQKLENHPEGAPEAWADLCHALICANDFIYVK
jgi:mono/diheme cytochrome c family protein